MDPNLSNPNDGGTQPSQNPVAPTPHVVVPPPNQPPVNQPAPPPVAQQAQPSPQEIIDRTLSQIPQQPTNQPSEVNDEPKKSHKKLLVGIAVLAILAVSLPLTIFLTQQQQNTKSGAANQITDATVVGSFNGQRFTVGDIRQIALEDYSEDQFLVDNHNALTLARDTYVERKILDKAQTDLGLTVIQDQINSLVNDTGLNQNQAKYELLKQQVILKQVNYVKAVSIGYWLPPDSAGQDYASGDQAVITQQTQEGKNAINQATDAFNTGQDVLTIANSISNNYKTLAPVLSMNGSKFALIPDADKQTASEPVLYEYGGTNFDDKTKTTLFGAPKNTVVTSVADQSSGGQVVFKIIDKGTGTFSSYANWLSQKEANYTPIPF